MFHNTITRAANYNNRNEIANLKKKIIGILTN